MTVYVDDFRVPARVGRINARWSHLTADTKAELHRFAASLGLRRDWFQDDDLPGSLPGGWHYDVTDSVRRRALALGAQPVPWLDFPAVCLREGRETHRPATATPPSRPAPTATEGRP